MCYAQSRPLTAAKSVIEIGVCEGQKSYYSSDQEWEQKTPRYPDNIGSGTNKKPGDPMEYERPPGQGLCYKPCDLLGDGYERVGISCTAKPGRGSIDSEPRHQYTRQPKDVGYSVHKKKRLVPFPSTSEEDFKNSPIGRHIQRGINGIRDGNPEEVGKAYAGLLVTANPAVLVTNTSEAADASLKKNNQLT
jgi:hypothetical protein